MEDDKQHIYTRLGDGRLTSLAGGERIAKDDARVEAYGTIDELNCHVGMLAAMLGDDHCETPFLHDVQRRLFCVGGIMAGVSPSESLPQQLDTAPLEARISQMGEEMGREFGGFVLPGGHQCAAQAHICRAVCRRAERRITTALALHPLGEAGEIVSAYINRLSDYFFVLARYLNIFFHIKEIKY